MSNGDAEHTDKPGSEACAVPIEQQCEATLAHYEHLATIAHEWNNQVPQAIRAWYAAKAHRSAEEAPMHDVVDALLLFWNKHHEHGARHTRADVFPSSEGTGTDQRPGQPAQADHGQKPLHSGTNFEGTGNGALERIASMKPRSEASIHGWRLRCFHCGYAWTVNEAESHDEDCAYVIAVNALVAHSATRTPIAWVVAVSGFALESGVLRVYGPQYTSRESAERDAALPRARGEIAEVWECYKAAPVDSTGAKNG